MKISIITVSYNSVKYLENCINSITNQSHKNIEYIIIDGASTDGTLSLLNSKRDQLSVLLSEPDSGIYDAMNKGINIVSGDVIGLLNSDDFYINNKVISKVVKEFENDPSLDACYADLVYVDQINTSKIVRYFKSSAFKHGLFSKGWCPPHPTFFVRRSVYDRFGKFDLNYRIAADVELMMRFLEVHNIKSRYIPEVWVKMRMGGVTNKNLKNILLQNWEILGSFYKNGLSVNPISFFIYKIISRFKQFFNRQT
jgi:glycosyltransferase involved in cell wall biosynthesis